MTLHCAKQARGNVYARSPRRKSVDITMQQASFLDKQCGVLGCHSGPGHNLAGLNVENFRRVTRLMISSASSRWVSVSFHTAALGVTSLLPSSSRFSAQLGFMMHRASIATWAKFGGSLLNLSKSDGGTALLPCSNTQRGIWLSQGLTGVAGITQDQHFGYILRQPHRKDDAVRLSVCKLNALHGHLLAGFRE